MLSPSQHSRQILRTFRMKAKSALMLSCVLALVSAAAEAQSYTVLHYFTGGSDGANPQAGVTLGGPGTLYGTTVQGGTNAMGVVFQLKERLSAWTLNPLHEFAGVPHDGSSPEAGVVIGPNGAVYGTTAGGGSAGGYGTVFELSPPARACDRAICYWDETILYSFAGHQNGGVPGYGNVTFDQAGNVYGTATDGGAHGFGVVWELTRQQDRWTQTVLYSFPGGSDGATPYSGVIFDPAGNLYGNTTGYFENSASVYELSPSNGSWVETTLGEVNYQIVPPYGTLIRDQSGNLYGTGDGQNGGVNGGVYEYSPSGGMSLVFNFGLTFCRPNAGVTLGPDGNLYGVCVTGGAFDDGWVFELPPNCNQQCTPNDLHDFDLTNGGFPNGPVVFDADGNLYGTALGGGNTSEACWVYGCGVVWEMTGVVPQR